MFETTKSRKLKEATFESLLEHIDHAMSLLIVPGYSSHKHRSKERSWSLTPPQVSQEKIGNPSIYMCSSVIASLS